MVEFKNLDTSAVDYALRFNFRNGHTLRCLNEVIDFLESVLNEPYQWPPLILPAIPADERGPIAGDSHFRPPGSPEEIVPQDAPATIFARRALDMAHELRRTVESNSERITPTHIGRAIAFGALLPQILEWYDGRLKEQVEAISASEELATTKKKFSEVQAAKGRKNSRLTADEWAKVRAFIQRQIRNDIAISRACAAASNQLRTGKFPDVGRAVEITPSALSKRYYATKRGEEHGRS